MRRMLFLAPAICVIVLASTTAWAEDSRGGRPRPLPPQGPFDPARLFNRLDAEKQGVISLDKLPERLPERLKEMLTKADSDGDGKVTREEFKAAFQAARKRMAEPREGAAGKKPPARPDRTRDTGTRPGRPERSSDARRPGRTGPPRRPAATRPPMPDLKIVFVRMDRDKSGELSLAEFTEGMRRLREQMIRRYAHARPPMRPHMGPHMCPLMGPPPDRHPGPSWYGGLSRSPRDPAARSAKAKPRARSEARPRRPGGLKDEKTEAKPERRGKPRDKGSDARPERPGKPRGKRPTEKPADQA